MRSRYRIFEPDGHYFITATTVAWLPVFTTAKRCDVIIDSLNYCRVHKGLKIFAWVILDSHLHAISSAPDLPRVLADFKRHTAQRILEQLEREGCEWLLNQLGFFCTKHKKDSNHQVWQEGVHPHEIVGAEMRMQKADYIHQNPVKRGLICAAEHWRYSSAHEWCVGSEPVFRCDKWE